MTEYYILIAIIFLLAIFSNQIKGWIGEFVVSMLLKNLDPEKYIIVHNILIKKEDGTTSQIDHVILSIYGIIVIETKNFKGWIFGNETNYQWTQTIYKHKSKFLNPILQNKGHIKALKEVLGEEYPYFPIIVFTTRATLKVKTETPVLYTINLRRRIKKYTEVVTDIGTMRNLASKLSIENINNFNNMRTHVKDIKAKIAVVQEEKISVICPKCGAEMKLKKGNYGSFYGCSTYPNCKETKKITT